MSKYQIGDILEVVGNESHHGFIHGQIVEITDVIPMGNGRYVYAAKDEDDWLVVEEDLSDLTFDPPSQQPDMVNSPAHYGNGKVECIEYIEDFLTTEEYIGYLRGNIAKYLHRWRWKGKPMEDLKKAEWYLKRLSEVVEDEECSKL